ncbi:hypothetical protein [Variovorax sp. W6]|uniref:hypothetical protein n=1 Tax=Variovorax sp. W6 TaxID=3093895 RepID=UPI003D807F18
MKDSEARRGRVGRLLSKFVLAHNELRVIMTVTEEFKNHADDWADYERYRKGISDRHFLEPPEKVDGLQKAIDDVSTDYPLHAVKFQAILDALLKSKKTSLSESAKSREMYVRVASLHEVSLDLCEKQLVKHIRRLSWMHGVITYARVRRMLRSKKRLETRNNSYLFKFSGETFAEMKKAKQRSAEKAGDAKP